jgi:hypothetical protein
MSRMCAWCAQSFDLEGVDDCSIKCFVSRELHETGEFLSSKPIDNQERDFQVFYVTQ